MPEHDPAHHHDLPTARSRMRGPGRDKPFLGLLVLVLIAVALVVLL